MGLSAKFTKPELSLYGNDTIPSNIDPSKISYLGELLSAPLTFFASNPYATVGSPDNNEGVSLYSIVDDYLPPDGSQGWTSVETVLVRFDTSFTRSGRFPVRANKTIPNGVVSNIGFDAAVCVQKYEPWIVEAYNTSTGSVSALRIVGGRNSSTSLSPSGNIRGAPISNTRYLNTTNKGLTFSVALEISIRQLRRLAAGQGDDYIPSPTVGPVAPRVQHLF